MATTLPAIVLFCLCFQNLTAENLVFALNLQSMETKMDIFTTVFFAHVRCRQTKILGGRSAMISDAFSSVIFSAKVDFGLIYRLHNIQIYNRMDSGEHLRNIQVLASNGSVIFALQMSDELMEH